MSRLYAALAGKVSSIDPPTRPASEEMKAIYRDIAREIREEHAGTDTNDA